MLYMHGVRRLRVNEPDLPTPQVIAEFLILQTPTAQVFVESAHAQSGLQAITTVAGGKCPERFGGGLQVAGPFIESGPIVVLDRWCCQKRFQFFLSRGTHSGERTDEATSPNAHQLFKFVESVIGFEQMRRGNHVSIQRYYDLAPSLAQPNIP